MKKRLQAFLGIIAILMVTAVVFLFTYLSNYYSYGYYSVKAMKGSDTVKVTKERDYIYFDGQGADKAVICYPCVGPALFAVISDERCR